MMDAEASRSSSSLLPRRPREPKNQTITGRGRHRRSHTVPHDREDSLSSRSSCSLPSCDSDGESNLSTRSSQNGQRPSTAVYSCHISCRVSPDKPGYFEYLRPYSVFRAPMKRSRGLPRSFDDSDKMKHPDLNNGQKSYLWHTASVYSMSNMKSLQERRYKQLLQHQVDIGFHTQEECDRYLKYLLKTRKRQYIADPRVWRNPPKIPVRPKSFHLPPPGKSQGARDYRYYPRGYEDSRKDEGEDKEGEDAEDEEQEHPEGEDEDGDQQEDKGHAEGKGQEEDDQDHTEEKGQTEEQDQREGNEHTKADDQVDDKANKDTNDVADEDDKDSDGEQNLSDSMKGVSLYYDPKRKATVTRGQKEEKTEGDEENAEGEKSPAAKTSHQNCFWGSH